MIDEVIVFTGSKRDFNSLLQERIDTGNDEVVSFMELIQHYNARILLVSSKDQKNLFSRTIKNR